MSGSSIDKSNICVIIYDIDILYRSIYFYKLFLNYYYLVHILYLWENLSQDSPLANLFNELFLLNYSRHSKKWSTTIF